MIVKCHQKGLQYCSKTKLLYFPSDLLSNNRLNFTRPDSGSKTHVVVRGKRKHQSGSEYLHFLAPVISVRQDLFDDFTVLIRIRIRLSDTKGQPFSDKRMIVSRRKHLCKNWWNKDWFNRTLAVSQFLADEGKITIGEPQEARIIIDATPFCMNAPVGINEEVLDKLSRERSELIRTTMNFQMEVLAMRKSEITDSIIVFDEPELEFRYGQRMADPRDGLSIFGPYDADLPSRPGRLPYILIGTGTGITAFKKWADAMNRPAIFAQTKIKGFAPISRI